MSNNVNIEQQVECLIERMFNKYYADDTLLNWKRITFFGGVIWINTKIK